MKDLLGKSAVYILALFLSLLALAPQALGEEMPISLFLAILFEHPLEQKEVMWIKRGEMLRG